MRASSSAQPTEEKKERKKERESEREREKERAFNIIMHYILCIAIAHHGPMMSSCNEKSFLNVGCQCC